MIEKLINLHLARIARKLPLILTLCLLIGIVWSCVIVPILSLTTPLWWDPGLCSSLVFIFIPPNLCFAQLNWVFFSEEIWWVRGWIAWYQFLSSCFQFPFLSLCDQNWYNMRRDFTAAVEDIALALFQMQSKIVASSCSGLILDCDLWDIKTQFYFLTTLYH